MNEDLTTGRLGTVDRTLRSYFQAALPDPWPTPPQIQDHPARSGLPASPFWKRNRSWAVAASLLLLVLGYLSVARFFPREDGLGMAVDPTHRTIGSVPGARKTPLVEFDFKPPMPSSP